MKSNDSKLGLQETFSMASGFAIGSGVITLTGLAIGRTGRSVVLSYLLSAGMFLLAVIPVLILASVYPVRSASYIYSSQLIHPRVGGFYMFVYFLGRLTIAMFSISFAQYLAALLPGIDQSLVAFLILTLFYLLNLLGLKWAARMQNLMFVTLVISLLLYVMIGMMKVDIPRYFAGPDFFVAGSGGVFSAASLLFFAVGGAGVLVDFGSVVRHPAKVIPKVVIIVTLVVTALYALLSMVAAGLLPYEQVAYQPLTNSAAAVFGQDSVMYRLFIIGGALLALTTTLNSSFVWYTNAMMRGCEDGWLPKILSKPNRYGVPWRLTTMFYLFGLIPILLHMDITLLGKIAVGLTTSMWIIPQAALVTLPKRLPKRWAASRYAKLPGWSLYLISIVSILLYSAQSLSNFQGNPKEANICIVGYLFLVLGYVALKKKIPAQVDLSQIDRTDPDMDG